jgi:hypothetical protein
VLAGPGQEVELSESGLRVGGKGVVLPLDDSLRRSRELLLRVPADHILVMPASGAGAEPAPSPWQILPIDRVTGRAWAQAYPIWRRGLLR